MRSTRRLSVRLVASIDIMRVVACFVWGRNVLFTAANDCTAFMTVSYRLYRFYDPHADCYDQYIHLNDQYIHLNDQYIHLNDQRIVL